MIQVHVQNSPPTICILGTITTTNMQKWRTGPFLPCGSQCRKHNRCGEFLRNMGKWDLYHPTSGSILQNYLKFIPKFPTHHSERSKYCNFWGCANSIIKGQKCRALEALEQQLSWSSRTTLFGFHYMNLSQQISENCLQM